LRQLGGGRPPRGVARCKTRGKTTIVSFYGTPSMQFAYTNNMSEHSTHGIFGSGSSLGLPTLAIYAPDANVCNNILAGGPASKYPACNYFPSPPFMVIVRCVDAGVALLLRFRARRAADARGFDGSGSTLAPRRTRWHRPARP
jgi:hypothetical protein